MQIYSKHRPRPAALWAVVLALVLLLSACGGQQEEDIQEAVRLILLTGKGERMMQPDFGCDLRGFAFEHMDYTTQTQMEREAQEALIRWEPRITGVQVRVEQSPREDGCLLLNVSYVVRATNNPYNLVYPYYINEGLEG